jgi:hypothetical protein
LVGIIAQASGSDRLCFGIASADLAVPLQRRDVKGAERHALQSVAALDAGGAEYEIALARPLQVLAEAYFADQRYAKAKDVHGWSTCRVLNCGTGQCGQAPVP